MLNKDLSVFTMAENAWSPVEDNWPTATTDGSKSVTDNWPAATIYESKDKVRQSRNNALAVN